MGNQNSLFFLENLLDWLKNVMEKDRFEKILEKYFQGNCTEEERQLLHLWFAKQSTQSGWNWGDDVEKEEVKRLLQSRLLKERNIPELRKRSFYQIYRTQMAVAASLVILLGFFAYIFMRSRPAIHEKYVPALFHAEALPAQDPSREGVLLELPDGTRVSIDSISGSGLQQVRAFAFSKLSKDEISFVNATATKNQQEELSAVVSVPKGRDYKVTLSDGTKVWLNAETRLTVSQSFNHKQRIIQLQGEAFFEVMKNKDKPFMVVAGDTEVAALGTSFNVNAYVEDKRVITTLSEGSVAVSTLTDNMLLEPNQQAISYSDKAKMQFGQVRADEVAAWKNGYFVFNQEDIYGIMKMIARWYNVEVFYQGSISSKRFGGTFAKAKSIDELLRYLNTLGNFRFKQKGRRIIVTS